MSHWRFKDNSEVCRRYASQAGNNVLPDVCLIRDEYIEGVAFKGHHVPETKGIQDVLDSGFHYLNSGIQVMGYGSLSVELGFPIPII